MKHSAGKILFAAPLILNFSICESANREGCAANESLYFSCITSRAESIRLCGAKNLPISGSAHLTYGGKVINSEKSISKPDLKYNWYSRFQTEYLRVKFLTKEISYTLYRDYDQSISKNYKYGVIEKKEGSEVSTPCEKIYKDNLTEFIKDVTCDNEDALGCRF
ncbi:hypothetical protein [Pseudomonas denitrificans (nom. rej.)]|uniref:Uncharacterized protein n=1 Tax=Pseudomonas denitrificans TaxID=43306 RepID=A0A9X7R455_PSEDE|nr:hypothetical protein [Pseudomonas denitrificans (nom. rej.)]QEY72156.1 hypothetical protein F1C79_11350 [Pseudomonas denitrificans (nom. rej.)]